MEKLLNKKGIPTYTKQFENWVQNKLEQRKNFNNLRIQAAPYKVPVVVHVVHNGEPVGTGMNVSDARILSQIDVLNKDFKRLNTDAANTPAEFTPLAGSLDIEFVMAKQTPEGEPTTGIVRVNGGRGSWPPFDEELNAVSFWPSEDYLNIWVTNIGSNFLGYAQFPVSNLPGLEDFQDGIAPTDGVVIDFTVFGVGSEDPAYNLGRTVTHEVGHFFGLRHIWGDDNGCTESDFVNDTPNQADETYECGSLVHPVADACTSMKMFQNYMDYTDDVCMNLFTQGQVDRMSLILEDTDVPRRSSLLTSHGLDDPICGSNPPVDIAITKVVQATPFQCNTNFILGVKNLSCPIVTSLKVEYEVNNGPVISTTVTGLSISNDGNERMIDAGFLSLVEGENTVSISISLVNNETDNNPANSDTLITITRSSVDIAITQVARPGPVTCNDNPGFVIAVKNLGCSIVTDLEAEYKINNGLTLSTTLAGLNIHYDNDTLINVGLLNLVAGENTVSIKILSVNGEPDANPTNSDTVVTIIHNTASDIIPLRKTFDDNLIDSWTVANPQTGILWNIDDKLRARFPTQSGSIGEESWLVSPVLDLKAITEASMFFNLSYSWTGQNDRLRILASTDCGDSYFEPVPDFDSQGQALATASIEQYLSINSLAGFSKVRLAFVGTNALGSNIYVDNIEFFVSDDPLNIDKLYAIYWDDSGGANITFNLPERQQVGLTVVDIMGRETSRSQLPDILNQTMPISTGNITSGLYIVRLQIGKKYYATKIYLSP